MVHITPEAIPPCNRVPNTMKETRLRNGNVINTNNAEYPKRFAQNTWSLMFFGEVFRAWNALKPQNTKYIANISSDATVNTFIPNEMSNLPIKRSKKFDAELLIIENKLPIKYIYQLQHVYCTLFTIK